MCMSQPAKQLQLHGAFRALRISLHSLVDIIERVIGVAYDCHALRSRFAVVCVQLECNQAEVTKMQTQLLRRIGRGSSSASSVDVVSCALEGCLRSVFADVSAVMEHPGDPVPRTVEVCTMPSPSAYRSDTWGPCTPHALEGEVIAVCRAFQLHIHSTMEFVQCLIEWIRGGPIGDISDARCARLALVCVQLECTKAFVEVMRKDLLRTLRRPQAVALGAYVASAVEECLRNLFVDVSTVLEHHEPITHPLTAGKAAGALPSSCG